MSGNVKAQSDWFSIRTDAAGDEYVASTGDEALVVPLTDAGEVLLAVEPSPAFGTAVRILPGGQVEPDLTLAEVANKELQEEIGYRAGRLDSLGELWPWAKYLAVRSLLFLARLSPGRGLTKEKEQHRPFRAQIVSFSACESLPPPRIGRHRERRRPDPGTSGNL